MPKWQLMLELRVNQVEVSSTREGVVASVVDSVVYTCGGEAFGDNCEPAAQIVLGKLRTFLEQQMLPKAPAGGES